MGKFFNRELSLLKFHERVLLQAEIETLPLLERLKYLCIFASNIDEFFEIRVAGLKEKLLSGKDQADVDGMMPQEVYERIYKKVRELVTKQHHILNQVIEKLKKEKVEITRAKNWGKTTKAWAKKYFLTEILPVLSPVTLEGESPVPRVLNKGLNFVVELEFESQSNKETQIAVVAAPKVLQRLVKLPKILRSSKHTFVMLTDLIEFHIAAVFPDAKVLGCAQFRLTRNSNLFVDEEAFDDLLIALEGELPSRSRGKAVRLEIDEDAPDYLVDFLMGHYELEKNDLYKTEAPVNPARLLELYDQVDKSELKFPVFSPSTPEIFSNSSNIFEAIKKNNLALLHPYQSFLPVLELLKAAAEDPDVLAIKQSIYRIGLESVIADYLVLAARSGKEVTVVIELMARFDEEVNIIIANRLQEAGVQVVYGRPGFKSHSKMLMVVRREGKKLVRYSHLGTGNYHSSNARLYTDYSYFTADEIIGDDLENIFRKLSGVQSDFELQKILFSPYTLKPSIIEKIKAEIKNAKAEKPAKIYAKLNALSDPEIINYLYEASKAGVEVKLLVRGICMLVPRIKGLSDNITVTSVVGRFLEHARAYYFENKQELFLSSADWMVRNLSKRVEVAFPIEDAKIKKSIMKDIFETHFADNCQAWELNSDGDYELREPEKGERHCAQGILLKKYQE